MPLPMSAHELCELVRLSRPIDAARLDRVLRLDTDRALVEVQANVSWRALASRIQQRDDQTALFATGTTVAQSIAWNAAGPDGCPAVTHVESLTMITPDGQLRRINRMTSPALFALAVGGQGLFGTLYSVTLRLASLASALSEVQLVEPLPNHQEARGARGLHLLVPPDQEGALVREVYARCAEWRIQVASVKSRPIRQEDETFLRWAVRDYAEVGVILGTGRTLGSAVRATQLRQELIDAAIARGGTFPISCTPEATRAQTQACYPQLAGFFAEQRKLDPNGKMANAWSRSQRSLLGREGCEVRWGT